MISKICRSDLAPPMCCQPPMSDEVWAERTARLAAARMAARERMPKACPNCGCAEITPTFMEPEQFECWNRACLAVWTVQP